MKGVSKVLFVIAGLLVICVMLIISVEIYTLDPSFYEKEYNKLKQAEFIGISRQDLSEATKNLIAYAKGERENLDMQAIINGEEREVFNEKEKSHMVDVKVLYLAARNLRNVSFIAAVVFMAIGLFIYKKGAVKTALNCYLWVCFAFFFFIGALGLWAALDFNSFWTSFHLLFFSNNLWLLDPSTDILIMMVPGQFFFDLVMRIIVLFASAFAASVIVCLIAKRILKKRGNAS